MQANSKFSRRGFLKATGGVSAAMLLAACAPTVAPSTTGGGEAAAPAAAKSLSVWAFRTFAPPADDVLLAQIDTWGKENEVDLEVVAEIDVPTMNDRIMAAVESKVLPDLSSVAGGRVALHYPANVYADVSELFKEFNDTYGGYFNAAAQTATIDGTQWVIPWSLDTSLMYYRTDVLEAKSLAIPTTWEEYATTMLAAQNPPDMYGAGIALNKEAGDCNSTFTMMRYAFGSNSVAEDGKTITINSQETRDWLNFVVEDMYNAGIFPPGAFEWDNASNNAAYQDESAVSINNPASVLVWLLDNKPELADVTAIQALPAGPAGAFSSAGVRMAYAMFNTSAAEKHELAADLLRYLQAPEQYEPWIEKAFAAPTLGAFESMETWQDPKRAGFLEAAKSGVLAGYPGPITPAYAEFDSLMPSTSMVLRVIIDGWTVDEAVEEQEQIANDVYGKYA